MAITIRKWRPSKAAGVPNAGAIGEPDSHVFNCPKCARPLTEGTPRCTGCGTRLIMGVELRRASTLMGFGFAVGAFVGGAILAVVLTSLVLVPAQAAQPIDPLTGAPATANPLGSAAPNLPDLAIPPSALSALRQTTLLDVRIAADRKALSEAYRDKASGGDLALLLRSLAADAAIGADLVSQLNAWPTAHSAAADRAAFYAEISSTAHDGLRSSVNDTKAYRRTAKAVLATLKELKALDTASRALASVAGLELPPVDTGS
jgi:hypothetical protein